MIVSIGVEDGVHVTLDSDDSGTYNPLVLDDLVTRARELFRDVMTDAREAQSD